jgi:hypothetical protein
MIRAFYLLTAIPEAFDNSLWIADWCSAEMAIGILALSCLIVLRQANV